MPRERPGRPRVYQSKEQCREARNLRRRERRRQHQTSGSAAVHSELKFQHSFLIYKDNITTVASTESDYLTNLSVALDDLLVVEQTNEEISPDVVSSPTEAGNVENRDEPLSDDESHGTRTNFDREI